MGNFSEQVFEVVNKIPRGKVASYGQVARMIGRPRSARYVGFALRGNTDPVETPCHRVVFKDGRICEGYAFGGPEVQRDLLEKEGVVFLDEMTIDMQASGWQPETSLQGRPEDIDWEREMGE